MVTNKDISKVYRDEFLVTVNNRLSYAYKRNSYGGIKEITCVSLEIKFKGKWVTIIYYDSSHGGLLHRHVYKSLDDYIDIVDTIGIRKKGTKKRILRWAIEDIKLNYLSYKKKFIKRSLELNKSLQIDLY